MACCKLNTTAAQVFTFSLSKGKAITFPQKQIKERQLHQNLNTITKLSTEVCISTHSPHPGTFFHFVNATLSWQNKSALAA
jgi:hypothetical protein